MADQIIDRLGVEFFSKVSPDFGANVEKAVRDFQDKIKPVLSQINSQWKSMAINVSAFFRMLKDIPAIDMSRMVNTQGIVTQASQTFKQVRADSVKEMEGLSSGVRKELNKAESEFKKFTEIVNQLKQGMDPIVDWGPGKYSKRTKSMYFPEAQRAIGWEEGGGARGISEQEKNKLWSEAIATYTQRQLEAYQKMEQAIGRIGAFERARIATQEIIARAAQEEIIAREKIAEFEKITSTLRSKGIITGKDDDYFKQAKKYLEDIWRTEKDINVLGQALDDIMQKLIGKNERVKDIIMESLGVKKEEIITQKKLVELAEQARKEYERARQASAGGVIGGGAALQAQEWERLVGVITHARGEVSEFQKRIQQINLRGFIRDDEFQRVQGLTKLINGEIESLIQKLAVIGSHRAAAEMARDFDRARNEITDFSKRVKDGSVSVEDMNRDIQRLTANLMELASVAKSQQLGMLPTAFNKIDSDIRGLTGGMDLHYKALRRSSLGTLELERVQTLLKEKLTLIRQEYDLLGGRATPALNQRFRETSEAVASIGHHLQVLTGRTSDAARAADRWGVGFKDMLKSQLAWLVGGALIFGTVFKIQQAFTEAVKTVLEFRQALVNVGAITEASAAEMVLLEKAAREVATSTKLGFMEAAEALKILGQAGMTARESAEALKTVAMMVTATGATSAESVKTLTTAINVWNLSTKDSARVGNVLAAALNYSKLEVGDLATSFNYLASTAAQVGMSLEETVSSIAVLSNMGIRASTIGTGLRGVIAQLIAPTKEFKEELRRVGIAVDDIRMPGNNLIEVLRKLSQAGFDMGHIFEGLEKRQAAMLTSMLNAGSDSFARMTQRITGTNAMMVMFERSMEGPLNRLIVFKNRLLDVALDFSGILIPGMEAGINVLTKLVAAFRDLGPIFAFVAALKLFNYMMGLTIVSVEGVNLVMTRLAATLTWLKGHPIFTALALLTAAYIGVKMAMEHEKNAREQAIKAKDREIQATIRQTGELENLAAALKSGNLTQQQAKDLVSGLAKEYGFLNEALTEHGVNVEKAMTLAINKVRDLDEELKKQKLERLVQESQKLYEIWKKIDDLEKRGAEPGKPEGDQANPWSAAGTNLAQQGEKMRQRLRDRAKEQLAPLNEAMEKGVEVIKPLLSAYTKWTEAEFRAMLAAQGLNDALIAKVETTRQLVILEQQQAEAKKNRLAGEYHDADMEKEILKLRREGADAYQNLAYWREDEMNKFFGKTKQAQEGRLLVEKIYQKKLEDLIEADRKKGLESGRKAFEEEVKERKKALEAEMDDIKLYYAGEEEIRRTALVKIQLLRLESEKERRQIMYAAVMPGKSKEGEELIDPGKALVNIQKLQQDYAGKEKGILAKANDEIAKLQSTQLKERIRAEREAEKELRQIRQETARAEIGIAKTLKNEIAAQEMLTNTRVEEEDSKHFDRLVEIRQKHATDYEELTATRNRLVEAELHRHAVETARITQEGEQAKIETRDRAAKKFIAEQKKLAAGQIDEATRYQALSLRGLEKQFDELSETVRNSEFGKKLKYEISHLTIDVYQKHRDEFQKLADLLSQSADKDLPAVQAAIAELMEGVERYNAKVREARRYVADFNRDHASMFQGMADGFQDFTNRMGKEYDIGRQAAQEFGNSVYDAIHSPLDDLFTDELKTFGDYWRSWTKDLGHMFSKMVTEMLFRWLGFQQAMEGVGAGGSFKWGKLLGGLLGAWFGGGTSDTAGMTPSATDTYYQGGMNAHGGGFIRDLLNRIPKRHSGGPSPLNRDEVLVKMLKDEYALNPRATRSLGKQNLDYMNQTGKIPGGLSISVPVSVEGGSKRLASHLRSEIEATVRKVVVEYAR